MIPERVPQGKGYGMTPEERAAVRELRRAIFATWEEMAEDDDALPMVCIITTEDRYGYFSSALNDDEVLQRLEAMTLQLRHKLANN